jgi:thiamine monophosphate synthase
MGEPLGPERVARIAAGARIPVVALGGVTRENARAAATGLAGVAAIRMFQETWLSTGPGGLAALVAELRAAI